MVALFVAKDAVQVIVNREKLFPYDVSSATQLNANSPLFVLYSIYENGGALSSSVLTLGKSIVFGRVFNALVGN